jgi:hypothetical protein
MKFLTIPLLAALLVPGEGMAWIAYGFKSGMSRFEVASQLSEHTSLAVTEGARETLVHAIADDTGYSLVYCSTPQKLYLMKFGLPDSAQEFARTLAKFERRYGEPEGLERAASYLNPGKWDDAEVSLIWNLNEFETILLTRDAEGARAEFQDVAVCR